MLSSASQLGRLTLLVERLLDADLLLDTEAEALLAQAESARLSLEAGDTDSGRRTVERIVVFTEALVRTDALGEAYGHAVIETARRILPPDA